MLHGNRDLAKKVWDPAFFHKVLKENKYLPYNDWDNYEILTDRNGVQTIRLMCACQFPPL